MAEHESISFKITILGIHLIRGLLNDFKSEIPQFSLNLYRETITIIQRGVSGLIDVHLALDPLELKDYELNVADDQSEEEDDDEMEEPCISIGFDTSDFIKTMVNFKKSGVTLYKYASDNFVRVKPLALDSDDQDTCKRIDIIDLNNPDISLPKYYQEIPNIKVVPSSFSNTCKSFVSQKCAHADIIGFEHGIRFNGCDSTKKCIDYREFGSCSGSSIVFKDNPDTNIIPIHFGQRISDQVNQSNKIEKQSVIRIPINIVKMLSKITNFVNIFGIIKFYMEQDKPIMIEAMLSCYGIVRIYLYPHSNH